MINLNICLSDIPKEKIWTADNGKKYLYVTVTELKDKDEKGNTHKVAVSQTKEERETKTPVTYLGRGKEIIFDGDRKAKEPVKNPYNEVPGDFDPLPF